MTKLFIIGNGFDIAHNIKTTYTDFKTYLVNTYPEYSRYPMTMDSQIFWDEMRLDTAWEYYVRFLIDTINKVESNDSLTVNKDNIQWNDYESSLGKLDLSEYLYDSLHPKYKIKPDEMNQQALFVLKNNMLSFYTTFFNEWIKQISLNNIQPFENFSNLIEKDSVFLTFNYTVTLEEIYEVKKVTHIHGKQNDEEVIIGHDEKFNKKLYKKYPYIYDKLVTLYETLRKDTTKVLNRNQDFFIKLSNNNITSIYNYGFSFSKPDRPYINKIIESVNTEAITWYLNEFDKDKNKAFMDIIRQAGFKGKFSYYN
ncbi:bacteriophage abortive infection AbiH family protein [Aerococcus urinaeequi]|uniref:bacteriophage abortive infection AbiH family protein n=1 Tax=Aerococcus urinaeequi TaxID=51665 RepID=UPI003B4649F5